MRALLTAAKADPRLMALLISFGLVVGVYAVSMAREDLRQQREHVQRMRWLKLDLRNASADDANDTADALDPGDQHL